MSRDLDQLLHDTAVVPTDRPDPSELVARGRRRRVRRHAAGTVAGMAAAVLLGVGVLQAVPTGSEPEILDQPPGADQPATDGDGRESIDRNALTEAERERLEAEIAEIRERIAQAEEASEQAAEQRAQALAEEADQRTVEELAAVRAQLEAESRALEEALRALEERRAAAEPTTVTGPPVLTASGGVPFAWTVTVSPGEDGQLCGDAAFGMQAEDQTGQPCSVMVGPDAVGNELFGSGGSSTNPEGQTLVWGLVDPDVNEVVVELADGSTSIATVAVGGDRGDPDERVAVWAFATEGEVTARTARAADGTEERLESSPMPG